MAEVVLVEDPESGQITALCSCGASGLVEGEVLALMKALGPGVGTLQHDCGGEERG